MFEHAHMFKRPAAEEVLPRSRNHGLKPSEEPLFIIRRCCVVDVQADSWGVERGNTCGPYERNKPRMRPVVNSALNQS